MIDKDAPSQDSLHTFTFLFPSSFPRPDIWPPEFQVGGV
jgi:hypothetical protein